MAAIQLWPEEWIDRDDQILVGATLERPDGSSWRLWYRLPAQHRPALTRSCDPFVLGALFAAMRTPADLVVHGEASPSLLANLEEFQCAWSAWAPGDLHRIAITADREAEQPRSEDPAAVMGFSGGADSAFTAWRHRSGQAGRQRCDLRAGVLVHGFDIPLGQAGIFAGAAERARRMLASIGMELIPVATNYREQGGQWTHTFGAGLVSCLMLLRGRFGEGLIASSYSYKYLAFPDGSNPLSDWMMSSDSFRIIHDGAAFYKPDKLRAISGWPEAMKYLRVCYEGEHLDRNCCRCQKCVWTILTFRMLGLGLPECFERDISNLDLLRMRYPEAGLVKSMQRLVSRLKAESCSGSWVRALQMSVLINRLGLVAKGIPPLRRFYRRRFAPKFSA
jgi:hypothetical protein